MSTAQKNFIEPKKRTNICSMQLARLQIVEKLKNDADTIHSPLSPSQLNSITNTMIDNNYLHTSYFSKEVLARRKCHNDMLPVKLLALNPFAFQAMECFLRYTYTPLKSRTNYLFVALKIGPWYVYTFFLQNNILTRIIFWFENSRVYITDAISAASAEFDLDAQISATKSNIDALVNNIIEWNTTVQYNADSANCLHFVKSVFSNVKIQCKNQENTRKPIDFFGTFYALTLQFLIITTTRALFHSWSFK